jgi:hypothetical protein
MAHRWGSPFTLGVCDANWCSQWHIVVVIIPIVIIPIVIIPNVTIPIIAIPFALGV